MRSSSGWGNSGWGSSTQSSSNGNKSGVDDDNIWVRERTPGLDFYTTKSKEKGASFFRMVKKDNPQKPSYFPHRQESAHKLPRVEREVSLVCSSVKMHKK